MSTITDNKTRKKYVYLVMKNGVGEEYVADGYPNTDVDRKAIIRRCNEYNEQNKKSGWLESYRVAFSNTWISAWDCRCPNTVQKLKL
jgi:hypothetical protein